MRIKSSLLGALSVLAVGYIVYPYVALFQLGEAIRQGDARTLHRMVDWPAVREGIKEDVCDLATGDDGQDTTQLRPFGASFIRGVTAGAIDQAVTPEALVAATGKKGLSRGAGGANASGSLLTGTALAETTTPHAPAVGALMAGDVRSRGGSSGLADASGATSKPLSPRSIGADVHVRWAFFDSPTAFSLLLQAPGVVEPIRMEMDLRHGSWKVRRVWLPAELLEQANART